MTRRAWVGVPAVVALSGHRMFGQDQASAPAGATSPHISKKSLIKYSRLKAAYKVPKNATKQAKHIAKLGALLSLTPAQQQQATSIFDVAVSTRVSLHNSLKAVHQTLSRAVQNNDSGAINQAATLIGNLRMQEIQNGATANAALLQVLTPDQKANLAKFQS